MTRRDLNNQVDLLRVLLGGRLALRLSLLTGLTSWRTFDRLLRLPLHRLLLLVLISNIALTHPRMPA